MSEDFNEKLVKLSALHQDVTALNITLEKCYPVAVVIEDQFLIHDVEPDHGQYQFIKAVSTSMPVPEQVRAAFQIEDYGGRIACVVTPDVFDSLEGYVTIFHEFVHCYQYETCEQTLKMGLDIARKAQEVGDSMWEINHPFPYMAVDFIKPYQRFLRGLDNLDHNEVIEAREALKAYLGVHDYEYMVWQEWKEGFARWVENLVKRHLGMPENKGGLQQPYSRVLFYAGGEAYIELLAQAYPPIVDDLTALFVKMLAI